MKILDEKQATEKIKALLEHLGFSSNLPNKNFTDFLASKRVGKEDYNIAIEIKGNSNINDAIKYGVERLTELSKTYYFQKLLLIILTDKEFSINNKLLLDKFQDYPTNLEILSLPQLDRWSENLKNEIYSEYENEIFQYVKQFTKSIILAIAKNPSNLINVEWRDLERTISEVFECLGFKVSLTPSSKDGGKDVILECKINGIDKSFIVEIKHWRSNQKVGKNAIKEFTQVIINEKRDKGLFLSTSGYTSNYYECLTEREKPLVRFGKENKVVDLCRTYEKVNSGIWNPIETMEEILFKDTIMLN